MGPYLHIDVNNAFGPPGFKKNVGPSPFFHHSKHKKLWSENIDQQDQYSMDPGRQLYLSNNTYIFGQILFQKKIWEKIKFGRQNFRKKNFSLK